MTNKEREKIFDALDEVFHPYAKRIMDEAPNITELTDIDGICVAWVHLEQMGRKNVTLKDAVNQYRKEYAEDAAVVKKVTGKDMPPLELDLTPPEYVVNEDLTAATIESFQNLQNLFDMEKQLDETGSLFDDEPNRFFGTEMSQKVADVLEEVNAKLDIIDTHGFVTVQKFKKPNPRSRIAVVAIELPDGATCFNRTVLKAFKEVVDAADSITVVKKEDRIRIAFSFENVWAKHRMLDDYELQAIEEWGDDDEED